MIDYRARAMRERMSSLHISPRARFIAATAGGLLVVAVVAYLAGHTSSPRAGAGNQSLRLDPGTATHRLPASAGGEPATSLTAGDYSTCALVRRGSVACWGDGAYGQLGSGTKGYSLTPAKASLGRRAIQVAAGGSHACAVVAGGAVDCWGSNVHGELGNGSQSDSATPVPVAGIRGATAVATGVAHSCAIAGGAAWCWGANSSGQLGDGTTKDSSRPVRVAGLPDVAAITAGLAHTCALTSNGTAFCWGSDSNGQLGYGGHASSSSPVAVTGLARAATSIDAGDSHTCALLVNGQMQCWGWNIEGQLGEGTNGDSEVPQLVGGLTRRVTAIATGGSHTCALLANGAVDCWGANLYGQLGNGSTTDSSTPVPVSGLQTGVVAIAAGLYHSCALLVGGASTCWGWNGQGQLGDGTTESASAPVAVRTFGLAPDGAGSMAVNPRAVPGSQKHVSLGLLFTAGAGGTHDGTVAVTVAPGWSLPSTKASDPGYATASTGRVVTAARTIFVTHVSLPSHGRLAIGYGAGTGAVPGPAGGNVWRTREQSSASGTLSPLPRSPVVRVLAPDGSGEVATTTQEVANGAPGRTLTFTYTAADGGVAGGTLVTTVPTGWSPPSTSPQAPGYVTASSGGISVQGRRVLVIGFDLVGGHTLRLTYGDRGQGGPGATSPTHDVGLQKWPFRLRTSPVGRLALLQPSPQITVLSADGSGLVSGYDRTVANGAGHVALRFDYRADLGGIKNGIVALTVPAGWSAPSTDPAAPGYVTTSKGKATVTGRTVHIPVAVLPSGGGVRITYGAGAGASAPTGPGAPQTWAVQEQSTATGKLAPVRKPPVIVLLAPDGSGSLSRATGPVTPESKANTVVFVYRAAPGGLQDGTVTLTVPAGWSAPGHDAHEAGFASASTGVVGIHGRTITVRHVTLSGGGSLTLIYGDRSRGGPGATAPKDAGPHLWPVSEQSTTTGKLVPLKRP